MGVGGIDPGSRAGHASFTRQYAIGRHYCDCCNEQTPDPPQSFLDDLVKHDDQRSTIWPFDGAHHAFQPSGWTKNGGQVLCPACSRAVERFLEARKNLAKPTLTASAVSISDHEILRDCIARAIELAENGLLTKYPPPAEVPGMVLGEFGEYRYMIPGSTRAFRTREDYREGMLRRRIREIHAALLGKPFDE